MAERTSANWRLVRAAYETRGVPVRVLAARYRVSASTIYRHIKQDGWIACKPSPAKTAIPKPTLPKSNVSAALLRRLYRTIDRKLAQLEARLESDEDMTIADHERETRAIGQLIRNVEKIAGLEQLPAKGRTDVDQAVTPGQSSGEMDAEQIRRELAERILRFREIKCGESR